MSMIPFEFDETPIRGGMLDEAPHFVGRDIAQALEYSNPKKALRDHCKHLKILKGHELEPLGIKTESPRGLGLIPESDVFRLIMRSNKPEAERFQDWVVEEVLPSIRATGSYGLGGLGQTGDRDKLLQICIREAGKGNLAAQKVLIHDFGFPAEEIQGNRPQNRGGAAKKEQQRPSWDEVMDALLLALHRGQYKAPWAMKDESGDGGGTIPCLVLRTQDVASHFNARRILSGPVSGRILKRELREEGVLHRDRVDVTIDGQRHAHMVAISLDALAEHGLEWTAS